MKNAAFILRFLADAAARGERSALVTLTDVIGRASRAPGTQMAVSETGAFAGSFSGGCVEAAVVGEAKRVIASGIAETLRLGDGSPFIDIKLPCGGGIDLLIAPAPPVAIIDEASRLLSDRTAITLSIGRDGSTSVELQQGSGRSEWRNGVFRVVHHPDLRLVIIGHGEETRALAALAIAYGVGVSVLTPDKTLANTLDASGMEANYLKTLNHSVWLKTDRYTAVVFLFHDHDWEQALLEQALQQDGFFIGAMGSRATQALRIEALHDRGVAQANIDRLVGPIGLVPATRDPETLALSALAQIAMHYDEAYNTDRRPTISITADAAE
jgi:xanthine dehydrogenase accessory factor